MRHVMTWAEQQAWRKRLDQLLGLGLIEFTDDRGHWRLSDKGVRMLSGCVEADAPVNPRTQSRAEIEAELELWRR